MFRSSIAATVVSGLGILSLGTPAAQAAGPSGLIAHRAVYDLELKDATDRSGIAGMFGRMVYEFEGSDCAGFTTNFRFVTQIDTGDSTRVSDQQTKTFEDLAKRVFRFETKSYTDSQLDKDVRGAATDDQKGIKVDLTQPHSKQVELIQSRFPTEHMLDIIQNAKIGKKFFEAQVFDGSDDGDKPLIATTVVGKQETPAKDDPDADKAGAFAKTAFWPVTVAYFNEKSTGDAMPVYRMSFKLYENGITRDLTMDYGDFVLTGKLTKLEVLDNKACQ
ncbi:ATP-binding protein [Rhizobium sp. AC27/96]|uniref:cell envelope integrity EipB family protein n=1 Tax=Rhizobium TaxID=379 RepID=UPI0008280910|nr:MULTISPECIES: cell envelope integrity EipB family protein [Rhizobium]NTF41886.1 cell envelope integrity EipB family protein [Rhizobium rhizogenes]OCJ12257.1 ATP-binding protein [Rhizobium sp. AC27/96]